MKKRVLYGVANYEELVLKNGYFVDKTPYIEKLERIENPIFLRPRRFGKSLWCRILECYYNIGHKEQFDTLFGHTYISRNPTSLHNAFFVLHLDFSTVDPSGNIKEIEESFNRTCNLYMKIMVGRNRHWFQHKIKIELKEKASYNLKVLLSAIQEHNLPALYIIIDEYDNFANQLIMAHKNVLYHDLMADDRFLKTFFKTMKEGRKTGAIANVYIIGVLPVTIDDLASGFNIGTFITLHPGFEHMHGFTQKETDSLLDNIYRDWHIDPSTRREVGALIKNHYNGYHFVTSNNGSDNHFVASNNGSDNHFVASNNGPDNHFVASNNESDNEFNDKSDGDYYDNSLYNSTILIYFLSRFCEFQTIPKHLTDLNLKTDFSWIRRLTASNPGKTKEFVNRLIVI